jgi:hypothetical protein
VFHGGASGIADAGAASAATRIDGSPLTVASAGDVNADGYDDLIIGSNHYTEGQTSEGDAFLFMGSAAGIASGLVTSADTLLQANLEMAQMGWSVAGAGDVNADGYDDVIVGAFAYDAGNDNEGAAFVFHGSATGIADGDPSSAATQLESDQTHGNMGTDVDGAGDVNGDGYDDVIVGATTNQSGLGAVFVFHGGAAGVADGNPVSAATRLSINQFNTGLGDDVAGAGDVNGDGYDDVVVGASGQSGRDGSAFVYLGSSTGVADATAPGDADVWLTGQEGARMGSSVDAGDVNGDGYSDVMVAAHDNDVPGHLGDGKGAAFIYHGHEITTCANGEDDDGDGLSDAPDDPGCTGLDDDSETNAELACDDGADNDGDGLIDEGQDPGCESALADIENPLCDNDIDDDLDGKIDWDGGAGAGVPDPQCFQPYTIRERRECGLGFELAPLLLALRLMRRRRG